MSDTKRILVWLFVLVWCVLSLAFRPGWAQQCGEDQLAANTIVIKKKAVASVAAGGGGCTTLTDSEIINITGLTSAGGQASTYIARRISLTASSTITEYKWRICDQGASGTFTAALYSDSSDQPGSIVDGSTSVSLSAGDLADCGSPTVDQSFALATPKSGVPGAPTTYWEVLGSGDGGDINGAYHSGTGRICFGTIGSWTCYDGYTFLSTSTTQVLMGCQP